MGEGGNLKIISDIRVYKSDVENIDGNSLPIVVEDKTLNVITTRIVMKLRENKFSLGEFDQLYINFTTCPVDREIAMSKRSIDRYHPWYRYYDVNISDGMFSVLGSTEIRNEVIELIKNVLVQNFVSVDFDEKKINSCFAQALGQDESMLMKFKEKVSAKRKAILYLRYLDNCRYLPLLRILDMEDRILFETDLPEMLDLSCLGDIQLSNKKVTVKPRKNTYTKTAQPLSFEY
ncbi:MAG: hypothetical protein K2H31_05880 [Lachnospiraceae bacterium]|nr:hypothetical protein [Lachnospiraceae bacterium]